MSNLMGETTMMEGGKNMAGQLSPVEHAVHIYAATFLYEGIYEEAHNCILGLYGQEVMEEAWPIHVEFMLVEMEETISKIWDKHVEKCLDVILLKEEI